MEKYLHGLRDEILGPINSGKVRPESTLSVAEFAEGNWLPWARENCKPSTVAGYETLWNAYLAPYVREISLRDFRTVGPPTCSHKSIAIIKSGARLCSIARAG